MAKSGSSCPLQTMSFFSRSPQQQTTHIGAGCYACVHMLHFFLLSHARLPGPPGMFTTRRNSHPHCWAASCTNSVCFQPCILGSNPTWQVCQQLEPATVCTPAAGKIHITLSSSLTTHTLDTATTLCRTLNHIRNRIYPAGLHNNQARWAPTGAAKANIADAILNHTMTT